MTEQDCFPEDFAGNDEYDDLLSRHECDDDLFEREDIEREIYG